MAKQMVKVTKSKKSSLSLIIDQKCHRNAKKTVFI